MKDVSLVSLTYNGMEVTRRFVDSVLAHAGSDPPELILVDNASTDGTPDYLRALEAEHGFVRCILNEENRGFAGGNNQGIEQATGSTLILINNDTVVTEGWIERLLRHLGEPEVGMVGPVTNEVGTTARVALTFSTMAEMARAAAEYTDLNTGRYREVEMLSFFCVAIRREVVDRIGLLDERFGQGMFEDDDFSRRAREAGFRLRVAEDVFIYHQGSASFNALDPEQLLDIWSTNKRQYDAKWGGDWDRLLDGQFAALLQDEARELQAGSKEGGLSQRQVEATAARLVARLGVLTREIETTHQRLKQTQEQLNRCMRDHAALQGSLSMRITAPLRAVARLLRRHGR